MSQPPITSYQIEIGTGAGAFLLRDANGLIPIEYNKLSTGIFSGGELSKGTETGSPPTTTKIDVAAGAGIVVDNYTDPKNPTYILVSWPAFTDVEITGIPIADRTFIAIELNGSPSPTVAQRTTDYSSPEHRTHIILGTIGHANNVNIVAVRNDPVAAFDVGARLGDLARAMGTFNISGNLYGPNGANLLLNKTDGASYRMGNNFHIDRANPDVTDDAIEIAIEWNYSYRAGGSPSGDFILTGKTDTINPTLYDDGSGTLQTVTSKQWTIQLIKHFPGVG